MPQYRKVTYSHNDFVPVMQHASTEAGLAVKADSTFKTLKDLLEYAKKNPGKVKYSTLGKGSPDAPLHGIYRQTRRHYVDTRALYGRMPAVTALVGGHVTAASASTEWKPFVLDGTLRLLATHGEKRMKNFPNVPTLKELGYDFYNDTTFIIMAPKGTPMPIVKKLEDAFHKAWADQEYLDLLARIDHTPAFRNSEDTRKFLEAAYVINGKVDCRPQDTEGGRSEEIKGGHRLLCEGLTVEKHDR